jgi:hypothetical protein
VRNEVEAENRLDDNLRMVCAAVSPGDGSNAAPAALEIQQDGSSKGSRREIAKKGGEDAVKLETMSGNVREARTLA